MAKKIYNFTQIPEQLNLPPKYKGTLRTVLSEIVSYATDNFQNSNQYKSQLIDLMNSIMCRYINSDTIPHNWSPSNPFKNIQSILVDEATLDSKLPDDLRLSNMCIKFDVAEVEMADKLQANMNQKMADSEPESVKTASEIPSAPVQLVPTPKEHLYIRPPEIPQFDVSRPVIRKVINGNIYTMYTSLPEVPTNQSQISATTDIEKLTDTDLLRLYPNHFVRTRASVMYEPRDGMEFDEELGVIFPVYGFTIDQVKQNIIQYPHIFKLTRVVDNKLISFYRHIEVDGELVNTLDIWDTLPESKIIPKSKEFIKEYVVRRYLLERDVLGINHNYPIYGSLDPYLTLFTTPDDYSRLVMDDAVSLARKCVESRIRYKQSRNPIMKAVNYNE